MALAVASLGSATPAFAANPVVTTNKVWLSGATHIFARMTTANITTSTIKEQGICYSTTNTEPTVDDNTSKTYLSNNGRIYNLSGLEPSTVYYIRAYVKKTGGQVIYGDPVKAITRPKGNVNYGINDGFPDEALTRIKSASKEAISLWNEYTGINGLYVTINYGSGTQTADCSYGGWMRVGPNASYQKTGTLLHEMLHAIGVGTTTVWQNSFMRSNTTSGYWLGVRATRALRFWDNSTTTQLNGDGTHMWPYGVNGAQEDAGTQVLYIGNSVLAEALGEDGLPPTSSQFAIPGYVFEQDDNEKYYLKNEELGTSSKFLRISKSGSLQWIAMTADAATANDSAAWNITYDPTTCYYSLKNVATGRYITYSSGFKTKVATSVSANEKFHFLPSAVEVATIGGEAKHAYWIGNVKNNTYNCMMAQNTNTVKSGTLNFSKDAGAQRWLVLTADEAKELTTALRADKAKEMTALLEKMETLLAIPHTELETGADATLKETIDEMKEKAETASADELETMQTTAKTDVRTFLGKVNATSAEQPFDITFLLENANVASFDGWSGTSPTFNYSCAEYYQKNVDIYQKLTSMPAGVYEAKVQAFQRPGATATVATDYAAGTDKVDTYVYVGNANNKANICNIMKDAQAKKLGVGTESEAGNLYVPNNMQAAGKYFSDGLYENSVKATTKYRATLTVGMKGSNVLSNYWVIFNNFRLYYYGAEDPTATAIQEIATESHTKVNSGVYTLGGQKVRMNADDLQGLPQGIYIVNGKKVVVK